MTDINLRSLHSQTLTAGHPKHVKTNKAGAVMGPLPPGGIASGKMNHQPLTLVLASSLSVCAPFAL